MQKIFVGGIPKSVRQAEFETHFRRYGDSLECKIIKDDDGVCRGFGFVVYKDASVATMVVNQVHLFKGRSVTVKYSQKQDDVPRRTGYDGAPIVGEKERFWVGLFPKGIAVDDKIIRDYFAPYGNVEDAFVINGKGFGFVGVTFFNQESREKITNHRRHDIGGYNVEVKSALPRKDDQKKQHDKLTGRRMAEITSHPRTKGVPPPRSLNPHSDSSRWLRRRDSPPRSNYLEHGYDRRDRLERRSERYLERRPEPIPERRSERRTSRFTEDPYSKDSYERNSYLKDPYNRRDSHGREIRSDPPVRQRSYSPVRGEDRRMRSRPQFPTPHFPPAPQYPEESISGHRSYDPTKAEIQDSSYPDNYQVSSYPTGSTRFSPPNNPIREERAVPRKRKFYEEPGRVYEYESGPQYGSISNPNESNKRPRRTRFGPSPSKQEISKTYTPNTNSRFSEF